MDFNKVGTLFHYLDQTEPEEDDDGEKKVKPRKIKSRSLFAVEEKVTNPKSKIEKIRKKFRSIDEDGSKSVSIKEVMDMLIKSKSMSDVDYDKELLLETTKFKYKDMCLHSEKSEEVKEDEWVHYRMLNDSAPSWIAIESINRLVKRSLREKPKLVNQLLAAFADGDVDGTGLISDDMAQDVFAAVCTSLEKAKKKAADVDENEDNAMDYYEFVQRLLVGERQPVELAMYDIAGGKAKYIPSMFLSGHKFEYIFHTGVRVFGKEYWYGGGVFASEPGKTPFGDPVEVRPLGTTSRSQMELLHYINDKLRWEYTYASYDVLHHNCNCFSNEVTQFLLNGENIPDEVRLQPVWAEHGVVMRAIKPAMNRWLGGFGAGNDGYGNARIDDMTDVWRSRLQGGDLATWRKRYIDCPIVVRILSIDHDEQTAHVKMYKSTSKSPEETQEPDVLLREIHPIPGHPTSEVMARNRVGDLPPVCELGHPLRTAGRLALGKPAPCGVCGGDQPRRMLCVSCREGAGENMRCIPCGYEMCGHCVSEGRRFQEGRNGGVFSDVITKPLAAELLAKPQWVRFKARSYFTRADQDVTMTLDRTEIAHLGDRICQELGVPELNDELDVIFSSTGYSLNGTLVDFDLFVKFFQAILRRAVPENGNGSADPAAIGAFNETPR